MTAEVRVWEPVAVVSPVRLDLTTMTPVERLAAEDAMRDPAWEGTARLDRYWPAIWWNAAGAVVLLVAGEAAWVLGGVVPLAVVGVAYLVVQVVAARRCAPKHPGALSAVAAWPLCLPGEGAGPWLAMLGLAGTAWAVGALHSRLHQPRRRRRLRPAADRAGVTR